MIGDIMAKIIIDTQPCDCGSCFEWKTFFLEKGEQYFNIPWDPTKSNVKHKQENEYGYHITIQCPECNRRYFINKEK